MKISVIIPCHNAERYLAQTIGSVLEQSRLADEILVVDDQSTDGSVDVAGRFGSRVTVVRTAFGSATHARNTGYAMASGDAFLFLDADDVLGPDVLRGLERALHGQPDGVAMCVWKRLELEEGRWLQRPASVPDFDPAHDRLGNWLLGHYTPPCAVLWSKSAYQRTGGWDERALVNNDGDIMMRAMLAGVPVVDAREGTAYYRRLPKGEVSLSGTRTSAPGLIAGLYVLKKIASIMEEQGLTERYRTPISTEIDRIEGAGGDPHPEIKQLCATLRDIYGESPTTRRRQRKHIVAAKFSAAVRSLSGSGAQSSPAPSSDLEIRFGLESSRRARQMKQLERTQFTVSEVPRQPRVSVIIPTFNRRKRVMRALNSVLEQTFADFEVLVVDDGSTDGTAENFTDFKDRRVNYLPQSRNQGVSAARNRGLREARGQYVAFLDSDDEWHPQMLAKQVAQMAASPVEVGLVYTGVESIGPDGQRQIFEPQCKGELHRQLLHSNCIHSGSGVMIRRNVIRVAGFFDEGIPAIEDFEYWLRVARFYNFELVAEPLVIYHDAADPARKSLAQQDNRAARKWLYNKHYREMQREEVAHLFLMDSAIRQWQDPDAGAKLRAVQLAAQAIVTAPRSYAPYSVFVRVVTPETLHSGLRSLRRRQPRPAAMDSGSPTPAAGQTPDPRNGATPQKRLNVCQFVLLSGMRSETFLRAHMEALPHNVCSVAINAWDKPALQENGRWIFPQTSIGRNLRSVSREPVRRILNQGFQRSLDGYLRGKKFDCVLAEYGPVGAVVARACAKAKVPLIVHFHGFDAHRNEVVRSLANEYQRLFKTAAAVVAVSRKMEASLVELGCPKEKIHLIPCGVNVQTFHQCTDIQRHSRGRPFHFVFVGRFVNKKGPLHLLLAFTKCLEHIDARLTMVGDGELTEVTLEVAQALGLKNRVSFPGGRSHEEVMAHMAGADCYVQHSIQALSGDCEGSPVSIIEAEAMGLPVIATRHAGIIDSVVDGVTGFLVEEGDVDAMGDRMAYLVEHPDQAARMGIAGREHVVLNYSMEVVSGKLSGLLKDCCTPPRPRLNGRVVSAPGSFPKTPVLTG